MHITNNLFSKTTLMIALFGLSNLTFAQNETPVQDSNITKNMKILLQESGGLRYSPQELYPEYYSMENANGGDNIILTARKRSAPSHDDHLKEHGGQIYQVTRLENAWIVDEDGKGNLGTKFDTLIGTDENRLFIEANLDKAESNDPKYDVSALYSRNVAPFWDIQAGVRYSEDKNSSNSDRVDGVIGVLGLAPYFFETQAYLYGGENNFWGASFELERDLLLTQKLITQPYIEADVIFSDDSNYAAKSGLSELKTGIKTRYEITKRIKPFIDVAYQYEKGQKATSMQEATESEKGWKYGAGIELVF
ncbi:MULTISPECIES: copper resistance protein B [Acinetobacter]|nr:MULTISPECIES: copper resistance protein B [Acinetobacter]ECE6726249.1 autotransporter domain-containing protein [Salmonella enterica subsp. enterica serovar Paratyphi A]MCU4382994.1 copper resistance protein B [Acinetobacter ursingii]MDH0193546.1 copper resistance protein B [Acinetobacter ursingii]QQT59864.1 copper resistance protein B [Acinetobacter johnsonii]QSE47624.1 copper resistance protein B [Acinetobacter johnsonii]